MSFFKKYPVLSAILLVVIIVTMIVLSVGKNEITPVEKIVGDVASPPSSFFNRFAKGVGSWFRMAFGASDIQKENAELKSKNSELESQLAYTKELELENERYKQIAGYIEEHKEYDIVPARISGKNPGFWFDSFTIDKGKRNDISVGNIVVDSSGNVIGSISETGGNWAKINSIIHSDMFVSALVERTRDNVMVRGTATISHEGSEKLSEVYMIRSDSDLLPGDKIVTSGVEQVDTVPFPKGLLLGEIVSVTTISESVERTAILDPAANFGNIEEVLVIRDEVAIEE